MHGMACLLRMRMNSCVWRARSKINKLFCHALERLSGSAGLLLQPVLLLSLPPRCCCAELCSGRLLLLVLMKGTAQQRKEAGVSLPRYSGV